MGRYNHDAWCSQGETTVFLPGRDDVIHLRGGGINFAQPTTALDMRLDYNAEQRQLNSGRSSQRYFVGQLHPMREAFYLYARQHLPQ